MVDVQLAIGDFRTPRIECLIDTGAPITVFPRGAADPLRIDLPDPLHTQTQTMSLLGDDWPIFGITVTLKLPPFDDLEWEAEVWFALVDNLPFGLLGYEGFLNHWVVTLNAYKPYTVIETVESFEERLPIDAEAEFYKVWPDLY